MLPILSLAQDPPDKPDLIRVTVDHSDNGVLIQWEASSDADIEFYHLYKRNADQTFELISTFSGDTLQHKLMTSGLKNLAYSVTAEDSTRNESLFEQNVHRAVDVSVEFDPCTPSNIITWSAYEGWEGNISGYKIYGGTLGSTMQLLNFVHPAILTYTHDGIDIGSTYNYYIETAHTSGITSLSAIDSTLSIYPDAPQYLTVDYVSAIDQATVELQFSADVSGEVNDFRVMKRSNTATPFVEVETITDAGQSTQTIHDQFPTSSSSYEYLVQSVFTPPNCNDPIVISESNPGKNIVLGYELADQMVTLSWTPYDEYDNGLSGYIIQRSSSTEEFIDIQSVGPATTTWTETIQSVINGFQPGALEYKVIAVENQGGPGHPGRSISNIITVTVETNIQVPNAFTPGSNDMNFEFKPIIDFAPKDYLMIVVDRGGRKMYETTDPGAGWDGRFQTGKFVNEGVYVYYIQFTDYTGMFKSFTGNVTVLFP
ncbi:MAG: gliding motility-associated C-terminal domain-containing protein [Bacteroidota bacterium]